MRPGPRTTCTYCGHPLTLLESYGGGICGDRRCREKRLTREADDERRRAAAVMGRRGSATPRDGSPEDEAGGATRSEPGGTPGAWESAPTVIVPWRSSVLSPLPKARRAEFLAHLDRLLESLASPGQADPGAGSAATDDLGLAAASHGDAPVDAPAEAPADAPAEASSDPDTSPDLLLGQVCAACRGACCHAGGTHAFLDLGRMREIVGRMGSTSGVRTEYLRRLPGRTVRGSCVFHTEGGCNLPRELRGELCNRYECRGLEMVRTLREPTEARVQVVHVVRREDQVIHDSAFAGEDSVERVRRGPRSRPRT